MRDREKQRGDRPGFSRRAFLKGSSVAVAATAMATRTEEASAAVATKNVIAADGADLTLNINGKDQKFSKVEPRVTLLSLLRNDANLTGCKNVDDGTSNVSGADTIMLDGKAVYAGSVLAHECAGKAIQTAESLKRGEKVDAVVAGFVKHDAMQCGFCTPGFVVATRALLNKNPDASLKEIQEGLGGNICRCGTYHGITQCALELCRKGGA